MTYRSAVILVGALIIGGFAPRAATAQQQTYDACYVPDVGALYLIGLEGLPTECLDASHVAISWTEGGEVITDHGNLAGLADDDHPAYVREGEAASGDLEGSYPDPIVGALQGSSVSSTAPTDGQILRWDAGASTWVPQAPPSGVTDHGNLSGLADDDHPAYVREGEAAGGDLTGTYPSPSVAALRGSALSTTAPSDGQVLAWDGTSTEWTPTSAASGDITGVTAGDGLEGGGSTGEVTLGLVACSSAGGLLKWSGSQWECGLDQNTTYSAADPITLSGTTLGLTTACATGQRLVWDGSQWACTDGVDVGDTAGGDLAGSYPDPSVAGLQGNGVSTTAPSDGQVLTWNGTSTEWEPQTPSSGVTDHGSLSGLADDDHSQYLLVDGVRDATDGFAVTGAVGTGEIPVEGAGVRLMWYPGKGAFRAGRPLGTEWDDANVGYYSIAMGYGTTASGSYSTATGNGTIASGSYSTATGYGTEASANYSTATGFETTASGAYSTAMGYYATASALYSNATGNGTIASGSYSTATGYGTTAQARTSLVIGRYNVVEGSTSSWVSTDPLFVAGNGTSTTPSNALTLYKNGNLTIAGTLTESSDRRLKIGIEPIGPALDAVTDLRPVRFRFREGTGHPTNRQIGLIAQDVAETFPELVTTDSEGYLSLAYPKLTAVLVRAVQELEAENERLEAQNERLTERLDRLEAAVRALEAEGNP